MLNFVEICHQMSDALLSYLDAALGAFRKQHIAKFELIAI